MKVGDRVVWVDAVGEQMPALVSAIWGTGENPCINVVFVSRDETRTDTYGRQIERQTSVVHKSNQAAHGWYWMHEGDVPNPVAKLQA